ncbi:Sulfotransferase 6B1 [Strongyloides ratti]|uniref:Sulfotransferase 6B1 n=1 Tax=Strongyloides ratti TaxID=34506 RepID=A0A090LK44_STRRB|nr:Sulfotransferase 6B1 [Strongyloides ratti]CEF70083.1 Sulfotransferase 6B1 [Strongyloides ratti]
MDKEFKEAHYIAAKERFESISHFNINDKSLQKIKNLPFCRKVGDTNFPIYADNISVETTKNMILRDDDIIVSSYPKCGSTWVRQIVLQLVDKDYWERGVPQYLISPTIECFGSSVLDLYPSPRIMKTHFNLNDCPKSDISKYIYVVRNPKDVIASYYNHMKNLSCYDFKDGKFNDFFNLFISPEMEWGKYFDNVKSWIPFIDKPNVLFLIYEDLCKDLPTNIKKITSFIGGDVGRKYENSTEIEKIIKRSSIDFMKANNNRFTEDDNQKTPTFIRKGGSRDWKNYLSKEQSDIIDELFNEYFKGTKLESLWKEEMKF